MTPPTTLFHSLLRPCVLQILRASGYHATKPAVLDSLTDLACRYLLLLCERTAAHTTDNTTDASPTIVDVRMALEDVGALQPTKVPEEQDFTEEEDVRGITSFLDWIQSDQFREIKRIALDDDEEITDYLNALKKRHSKTTEEAKYHGTVIGRPMEQGDILVEGGDVSTIQTWITVMMEASSRPATSNIAGPKPSSRTDVDGNPEEMDLS